MQPCNPFWGKYSPREVFYLQEREKSTGIPDTDSFVSDKIINLIAGRLLILQFEDY